LAGEERHRVEAQRPDDLRDPDGLRGVCDEQPDAIRASVASNGSPGRKMGLAEMLDLDD
jgi:hypothetical protein